MEPFAMPEPLRDRLGPEATAALVDLLQTEQGHWSDHVLTIAAERFERRLSEQSAALRIEMHDGFSALRVQLANMRAELLKWSFLFWIGQVAAIAGLLAFMLRGVLR